MKAYEINDKLHRLKAAQKLGNLKPSSFPTLHLFVEALGFLEDPMFFPWTGRLEEFINGSTKP